MAKIESVRELEAYKMAFEAAMRIFHVTKAFPAEERFSLTDKIRRASRSVCTNLSRSQISRKACPEAPPELIEACPELSRRGPVEGSPRTPSASALPLRLCVPSTGSGHALRELESRSTESTSCWTAASASSRGSGWTRISGWRWTRIVHPRRVLRAHGASSDLAASQPPNLSPSQPLPPG